MNLICGLIAHIKNVLTISQGNLPYGKSVIMIAGKETQYYLPVRINNNKKMGAGLR